MSISKNEFLSFVDNLRFGGDSVARQCKYTADNVRPYDAELADLLENNAKTYAKCVEYVTAKLEAK